MFSPGRLNPPQHRDNLSGLCVEYSRKVLTRAGVVGRNVGFRKLSAEVVLYDCLRCGSGVSTTHER